MTALEPRDAVIVAAKRTPIGRRGGGLRDVRPDDLAAGLVRGLLADVALPPERIDDVIPAMRERWELVSQGHSAERMRERWGFSRRQLDDYALGSHERAVCSARAHRFDDEILPVEVSG